jgi:predicted small lipoprotein YifL
MVVVLFFRHLMLFLCVTEQIESEFPFFPCLHAILAARPNVVPIAITTGVGPCGRKTVFYQPPDNFNTDSESAGQQTTNVVFEDPVQRHQFSNLLEALVAAGAVPPSDASPNSCAAFQVPSQLHMHSRNSSSPGPIIPGSLISPSSSGPNTYKENIATPTSQGTKKKAQKTSQLSLALELLEKARSSIKKIPPKPMLEETLIQVQRYK